MVAYKEKVFTSIGRAVGSLRKLSNSFLCTYLFSFQVKYLLIPVPLYLLFLTFCFSFADTIKLGDHE